MESKENEESPLKRAGNGVLSGLGGTEQATPRRSGRVIESLHSEIDALKTDLIKSKQTNDEYKKSNELLKTRRDKLLEQLSNSRHEVDTINSLLQRKQRRINDLESQLNDTTASNDDLKFKYKNLQTQVAKMMGAELELERVNASYKALVKSQADFKKHYLQEISSLKSQLSEFIDEKNQMFEKNITLIKKADNTIFRSLKSINLRNEEIETDSNKRIQLIQKQVDQIVDSKSEQNAKIVELIEHILAQCHINTEEFFMKNFQSNLSEFVNPQPRQQIRIAKRGEKKAAQETGEAAEAGNAAAEQDKPASRVPSEDRVNQLTKELNGSIPTKHRTAKVSRKPSLREPSNESKSHSRSSSYSHKPQDQHYKLERSRSIDIKPKPQSRVSSTSYPKPHSKASSRVPSNEVAPLEATPEPTPVQTAAEKQDNDETVKAQEESETPQQSQNPEAKKKRNKKKKKRANNNNRNKSVSPPPTGEPDDK